ncbi:Riboflavin transporter MCH5 [Leucoagaricus sp. SymC.cos]|nr:Riboflavin transporter MCH5 [Leucoagaricus sp. SymC.cos]
MSPKREKSSSPVNALPVEDDIMDSSFEAWSTVMGGFLTVATTFSYTNSFGVYQDLYMRSNTASASVVSWIGSTQIFFLLAMALPGGKLLDMGYFCITTLVGSLIFVFLLFMLSICHTDKFYQLYLSQGLGMGIGAGLLYVPSMAVQAHHWRTRRALAMGIVATGSSLGRIVFPIMLNQLFKGSAGFQWGVHASAFIVLGMLIFANLLMKAKPHALAAEHWGIFFPYFYFQLFAVLHSINPQTAFYCILPSASHLQVVILNAGAVPRRILPNMLANYFGTYNVGIPCVISCGILIFAMTGVKTVAGMILLTILYGFMSGAVLALTPPVFAALSRDPSEVGVWFGIAFSLTSVGALMGNPIDGALLGETFPWIRPITFSSVGFPSVLSDEMLTDPYIGISSCRGDRTSIDSPNACEPKRHTDYLRFL